MMRENGLVKLTEECGEALQVVGKMLQYPELQHSMNQHPDGTVLRERLEEELGDLTAAVTFVVCKLGLDIERIAKRGDDKLVLFAQWDREPG